MPRKRMAEAQAEEQAGRRARIRYLLRNSEFQRDFNGLRHRVPDLSSMVEQMLEVARVAKKWDIPSLLGRPLLFQWRRRDFERLAEMSPDLRRAYLGSEEALWKPLQERDDLSLSAGTIPIFEAILTANVRSPMLLGDVDSFVDGGTLWVSVDLTCNRSADSICALVEGHVRSAVKEHSRSQRGEAGRRTRRRLDKVDFHLAVYDRAEHGEPFKGIAKSLARPISSVKSAFLAASRSINGGAVKVTKKATPLASFDPSSHIQNCLTCRKAQRPEELCRRALLYANQDYKGQRELTGFDTVRDTADTVEAPDPILESEE